MIVAPHERLGINNTQQRVHAKGNLSASIFPEQLLKMLGFPCAKNGTCPSSDSTDSMKYPTPTPPHTFDQS